MNNQNYYDDNSSIPNDTEPQTPFQDAWPFIAATPPSNQPIFSPTPYNEFKTNEFLTNDHFPQSQFPHPPPPFYTTIVPYPSPNSSTHQISQNVGVQNVNQTNLTTQNSHNSSTHNPQNTKNTQNSQNQTSEARTPQNQAQQSLPQTQNNQNLPGPHYLPKFQTPHSSNTYSQLRLPDLHPAYVNCGWEQHFSPRYNKQFYYNKISLQSVWSLPSLNSRPRSPEFPPYAAKTQEDVLRPHQFHEKQEHVFAIPGSEILTDYKELELTEFNAKSLAQTTQGRSKSAEPELNSKLAESREFGSKLAIPSKRARLISQNSQKSMMSEMEFQKSQEMFTDPWDFKIAPDVKIYCTPNSRQQFVETAPVFEIYRAQHLADLRKHYDSLCQKHENIKSPEESFSRWIVERKLEEDLSKIQDPIVPNCSEMEYSQSMFQDILRDIPMSWKIFHDTQNASRNLFQFTHSCQKLAEARTEPGNRDRAVIFKVCQEEMSWLKHKGYFNLAEDCQMRLMKLRRRISENIINIVKPSIENICLEMDKNASDFAIKLNQMTHGHLKNTTSFVENGREVNANCSKVFLNPINQKIGKIATGKVEASFTKVMVYLKCNGSIMRINRVYYRKVKDLYNRHNTKISTNLQNEKKPQMKSEGGKKSVVTRKNTNVEVFHRRLWCMLKRYQTIFGANTFEEQVYQGALPISVYQILNEVFGVTMECFASPLNSYFKNYGAWNE